MSRGRVCVSKLSSTSQFMPSVDGNGQYLRARKLHHTVHVRVHRLFHHHAVAGLDEQRHDKVERLIRLREDLNFARGRLHALRAEKGHELLPQEFIALIGAEKYWHGPLPVSSAAISPATRSDVYTSREATPLPRE